MLVLVLSTVFAFSSCKDDDEDNKAGYSIVGTWKCTYNYPDFGPGDYDLLTFNTDGTGRLIEFYDGEIDDDEFFTYSYTGNVIIMYCGDEREVIMINWLSRNMFTERGDDYIATYVRQ